MKIAKAINPVNSLIFISDRDGGNAPPWEDKPILSTNSCISVRCYPEQDGPTEVTLGDRKDVDPGTAPAFEGDLETLHRKLVVTTVEKERVLEANVPAIHTHICIWLSHPRWPEKVVIGYC
jgi:hypothetical protein